MSFRIVDYEDFESDKIRRRKKHRPHKQGQRRGKPASRRALSRSNRWFDDDWDDFDMDETFALIKLDSHARMP